ncbi:beta-lactamase/transpeptidase-like protein [Auriculariales sp. MPI-PUGE-AT-0066]|nr:beta-lactamase/transpeptidase-like protein [Auriculariales sp. MPI-PUGE-AT-0066]
MSTMSDLQKSLQSTVEAAVSDGLPGMTFGALWRNASGDIQRVWASSGSLKLPQEGKTVDVLPDTILPVLSCTKLIVAIAVMQLVERGEIALDDLVNDILPELIANGIAQEDGSRLPLSAPMTVKALLTHTAGLGFQPTSRVLGAWYTKQSEDYKAQFPPFIGWDFPSAAEPGKVWAYSHSLDWLGRLIARKTGLSLEAGSAADLALQIQIFFEKKSHFELPQWGLFIPGSSVQWLGVSPYATPGTENNGGAGGITTMRHFAEIAALLITGGVGLSTGRRVLKQETVQEMLRDQLTPMGITYPPVHEPSITMQVLNDDGSFPTEIKTGRGVKKTFTFAGEMNLESLENGRGGGSVSWGGAPGIYWS